MDADGVTLVNEKLFGYERCLSCLFATSRELDGQKVKRLVALVESQGEVGLFCYTCGPHVHTSDDLQLHRYFIVDSSFSFVVASTDTETRTTTVVISRGLQDFAVDFTQNKSLADFLGKLKQAIYVHEQNKELGVVASFSWLDKYTSEPHSDAKWFVETADNMDDFDPIQKSAGSSHGGDASWMHSLLTQENVGSNCPVVSDTTGTVLDRSSSVPNFQKDLTESGNHNGSPGLSKKSLKTLDKSVKRSYEKSLDSLDSKKDSSVTGDGGREDMIRLIMQQKEDEYTILNFYRVFCGTWNVNGQPASEAIHDWLCPDEDQEPPDIYAVGFQELDLSKNAYIFTESVREEDWYKRVKEALHPKAKYKKLKLVRLVGMMLIVFIREGLELDVYDVMGESVGTGLLGMMGNKGGVAVRFGLRDTNICFINTHLAAHTEEFERRNQDFRDINARMHFGTKTISDHDIVFWQGDLNYRLSDIDVDTCKKMLEAERISDLMEYDQLTRQVSMKRVFLDYLEGRILFPPTYKYDPGTDTWDTSEKCRTPAWTDRILWRGSNIHQDIYRSHPKCKLSDHKPVSSIFKTGVRVIDRTRQRVIYEDVMKQLDRWENEFLPQVKLTSLEVEFPAVKFIETHRKTVTVLNTGQVPVRFEFIPKPNDKQYCQPWLTVEPNRAVIKVGGSCEIQFEVYVDRSTAPSLNQQQALDDILVLHLEGGKDFFLTVRGNYIACSFGQSVEDLVHMFKPMNTYSSMADVYAKANTDRPLDVPKEIWRLVDFIYRNGMRQEDLFRQPGHHHELQQIRDCLDSGAPDIPGNVHSVAEALLMFLDALPDPVIPTKFYSECLASSQSFAASKQLLQKLPLSHRNTFKYLCAFLQCLLEYQADNKLDATHIASSFGSILIRRPPFDPAGPVSVTTRRREEAAKATFVQYFLLNDYSE